MIGFPFQLIYIFIYNIHYAPPKQFKVKLAVLGMNEHAYESLLVDILSCDCGGWYKVWSDHDCHQVVDNVIKKVLRMLQTTFMPDLDVDKSKYSHS